MASSSITIHLTKHCKATVTRKSCSNTNWLNIEIDNPRAAEASSEISIFGSPEQLDSIVEQFSTLKSES
jgi:hypothetical protein